jgi:hypothetical protein
MFEQYEERSSSFIVSLAISSVVKEQILQLSEGK